MNLPETLYLMSFKFSESNLDTLEINNWSNSECSSQCVSHFIILAALKEIVTQI